MRWILRSVTLWIALCGIATGEAPAQAATKSATRPAAARTPDPERVKFIASLLAPAPKGLGTPADDRAAWDRLAAREAFKRVVSQAAKLRDEPIPELPDELYLDFSKTGNRTRWETVNGRRSNRLHLYLLAECIEGKGRFVKAYEAGVRALCSEPTWVMPAHDRSLMNFKNTQIDIDLKSSRVAAELATGDYLLSRRLSPEVRELIRKQVSQRVLNPYRDMVTGKRGLNGWVRSTNNWNAVCHAGVTAAALWLLESREERAFFIAAAEMHVQHFLAGFGADGYCSEGVGYWNYGFGHFLLLAEMVHQATAGRLDLLQDERARLAALYGANIEVLDGVCPPFSDCSITARPADIWMWYINRRFSLNESRWEKPDLPAPQPDILSSMVFNFPNTMSTAATPDARHHMLPARSWFESSGILICRPGERASCRLGVGMKGGHNAEHHNHNDVGSYVLVVGGQMLLADPGAEVYTARTFSSRRYESQLLNSYGHPVPIVAGRLQRTGAKARGRVVRADFTDAADTLVLDMRSAYDVKDLTGLQRTFLYSREKEGQLTVTDEAVFASPQPFGTALVTLSTWEQVGPGTLRVYERGEAIHVSIDTAGAAFSLRPERIEGDIRTTKTPTRLGISLAEPVTQARVTIVITPASRPSKPAGVLKQPDPQPSH